LEWGPLFAGLVLSVFAVVRLVARRTDTTWFIVALLFVGWMYFNLRAVRPAGLDALYLIGVSTFLVAILGWVLWKHGALALAMAIAANGLLLLPPWTLDLARWFAWRQWAIMAIVVGLAVWGFRNVLGRQSIFPAGSLDG
jgi:hypothetical protein